MRRGWGEAIVAGVIAAGILALFAVMADVPTLRRLETATIDVRFRWRGHEPAGSHVALLLVDDASLAALGRWPLNRHLLAEAVRELHRAGAAVIAFDMLFPERDQPIGPEARTAIEAALAASRGQSFEPALERLASDDPDGDFAGAMKEAGNVLLPVALNFTGPRSGAPDYVAPSAYVQFGTSDPALDASFQPVSMTAPTETLATAAAGLGHVDTLYDVDSIPRYEYAAFAFDGDFYPALVVRAAAEYMHVPWPEVVLSPGRDVTIGRVRLPTDGRMRFLVDYHGPRGTFPTYSFLEFLRHRVPPEAVAGRVVLIGGSFTGNADSSPSPFESTQLPGSERLANEITMIVSNRFITQPSIGWALALPAIAVALAAAAGRVLARVPTRSAALGVVLPPVLWAASAQTAFDHGLLIPFAAPVLALGLAGAGVLLFRYWVTDREGRLVRSQFRRYLAPEMVDILAREPGRLRLGGETRQMTVMFCDLRGFTTIAEQFKAEPQELTRLVNRFLTPMTEIIMAHGGTIDKYIGDCIMAFWNAPLEDAAHAHHACAAALAMREALAKLNDELCAEARASGRVHAPLRAGIGINTGACVVGNMGSDQRFAYSALGDAVNLASRLESQSKLYGVDIVMGETTRAEAPAFAALELDRIAVKGKQEAVRVFALMGDAALDDSPEFRALAASHADLLARYRAQDWACAEARIDECCRLGPELTLTYDLYRQRIAYFLEHPVGPEWQGVFVAVTK